MDFLWIWRLATYFYSKIFPEGLVVAHQPQNSAAAQPQTTTPIEVKKRAANVIRIAELNYSLFNVWLLEI